MIYREIKINPRNKKQRTFANIVACLLMSPFVGLLYCIIFLCVSKVDPAGFALVDTIVRISTVLFVIGILGGIAYDEIFKDY